MKIVIKTYQHDIWRHRCATHSEAVCHMAFHMTILLRHIAVFAEMIYHNNRGLGPSVDREDRAQGGTEEDRYVHIPV